MLEEQELIKTPIARELLEISAIAASPFILLFLLSFRRKKAAITITGMENFNGARFKAAATDMAPNPTCERPSPIMENRFNTRLTPSKEAESVTSSPTINARFRKS